MPSVSDPCGEGVEGPECSSGDSDSDENCGSSARAVVGAALTIPPLEGVPNVGSFPADGREVVEIREDLEPGRRGEARLAICGLDPECWDGESGSGSGGGGEVPGDTASTAGTGGGASTVGDSTGA